MPAEEDVTNNSENRPAHKSAKELVKAGGAVAMSAAALLLAHPSSAAAEHPPKPTPVTKLHKTEIKLRQEILREKKIKQQADRMADAIALALSGQTIIDETVTRNTIEGIGLKSQDSLPGANMEVTPEQQEELEQATVHILRKSKGSEGPWQDWCTATRITYEGQIYVVSARHCYQEAIDNSDITTENVYPAYDFMPSSTFDYAATTTAGGEPIVYFDGLSMDMNDDWALLRPKIPQQPDTGYEQFSNLPALNYDVDPKDPIVGEKGITHGYGAFNGFQPASEKVTYLGKYTVKGLETPRQTFYLVAINPKTVTRSGCLPGYSGSSVEFSSGATTGPLTYAYDFGYANPLENSISPFKPYFLDRYIFEQLTGINLEGDEAVCAYGVRTSDYAGQKGGTMVGLTTGFTHPVQVGQPGKGGDSSGLKP